MVNRYFRYSYKLMPFPIHDKLVIAVASSALFDLRESDAVYREKGTEVYRKYQRDNECKILDPGVAFPFIRRLLKLNSSHDPNDQPSPTRSKKVGGKDNYVYSRDTRLCSMEHKRVSLPYLN